MLKTECIYRAKPQTFDEAKELVDEYIYFYNNERIQLKTGQTPMEVRYAYQSPNEQFEPHNIRQRFTERQCVLGKPQGQ